ncbi:flavin-containing monooxygenase [Phytohabitans kaempferiae]|uniref:Flavin-containing monooxygenase n=1 Tax=Phytohabitans kaempferiae TaxID=1620943 RepID=A0ABV6LXY9_9ACTN
MDVDVAVVGAGFAGLYAVHRCARAGLTVQCFEAGGGVGGTWYWNRYPGARCDVESVDYSYSFDPDLQRDWKWSENYATQPEILAYLEHVADRFGLRRYVRLGERVVAAAYDSVTARWRVRTDAGTVAAARFLVLATGSLSQPVLPDIPGVDTFAGRTLLTARWPTDEVDVAGQRVAVVGTGSSGIQSIPILARAAARLTVFQRSPNFSVPVDIRRFGPEERERIEREYPERRRVSWDSGAGTPHRSHPSPASELTAEQREAAFEERWRTGGVLFAKTFDGQMVDEKLNELARDFVVRKIRATVADPRVADELVPTDHPIGTKRICTDSGYYETFNLPHVNLVNLRREPITEVTPDGIRTTAGRYEFDVIIYATGFDAMTGAVTRIDIRGPRGDTAAGAWRHGPVTYLGLTIPGLPNLFVLNGPGSPSVLANMVMHAEQQVDWVVDLVDMCRREGIDEVEPRADAAEKWTAHVTETAEATLFPRANSWYMGANIDGKTRVFMPYLGGFGAYRRICAEVAAGGYEGFVLTRRFGGAR